MDGWMVEWTRLTLGTSVVDIGVLIFKELATTLARSTYKKGVYVSRSSFHFVVEMQSMSGWVDGWTDRWIYSYVYAGKRGGGGGSTPDPASRYKKYGIVK